MKMLNTSLLAKTLSLYIHQFTTTTPRMPVVISPRLQLPRIRSCVGAIGVGAINAALFTSMYTTTCYAQASAGTTAAPTGIPADVIAQSLLRDQNGDGKITIIAFGDSITQGVGDNIGTRQSVDSLHGSRAGTGYPRRVSDILQVGVANYGNRGERLVDSGRQRFISTLKAKRPDAVLIMEGANDALERRNSHEIYRDLQTMINVSRALNVTPILLTLSPACAEHSGAKPYINAYNAEIYNIVASNNIPLADVYRAFNLTCNVNNCHLLNLPEGIHPNISGYDVIAEVVAATLLNIDILTPEGQAAFLQALNLPAGSLTVKPFASAPTANRT